MREELRMANLFYVHWDEGECRALVSELESAGHRVRLHWSKKEHAKIEDDTDVLIISLDRLPSHGRAIAEWFWAAKKRRAKPIVFVGGEPPKVTETKKWFPSAVFCTPSRLSATVDHLVRSGAGKRVRESRAPGRGSAAIKRAQRR